MVTPEAARSLESAREVFIATFDADGAPGTVPMWFVLIDGRVYVTTGSDSRKAHKLRADPRARLAVGSRDGPALAGTVRFASDPAVFRRASDALFAKYEGYWTDAERLVRGWERGRSVLLEVTPDPEPGEG